MPNLAPLPLHRDAGGIADLDPDAARAGSIRAIELLRHDALGAKPADVREDDRAVLGDVLIKQDAGLGSNSRASAALCRRPRSRSGGRSSRQRELRANDQGAVFPRIAAGLPHWTSPQPWAS